MATDSTQGSSRTHTSYTSSCCGAALSGEVNTSFQEGAAFLRDLGLENQAEIARILDIAMNPNSLFVSFHDRNRAVNGSVRFRSLPACATSFSRSQCRIPAVSSMLSSWLCYALQLHAMLQSLHGSNAAHPGLSDFARLHALRIRLPAA